MPARAPGERHTDRHDLAPWKRPIRVEPGTQALARDHLERHVWRPILRLAAGDSLDHVRMLQVRNDVDFLGEPGPKFRIW